MGRTIYLRLSVSTTKVIKSRNYFTNYGKHYETKHEKNLNFLPERFSYKGSENIWILITPNRGELKSPEVMIPG